MHDETLTEAFSRQSESFNRSAVANDEDLLGQIIDLARIRVDSANGVVPTRRSLPTT